MGSVLSHSKPDPVVCTNTLCPDPRDVFEQRVQEVLNPFLIQDVIRIIQSYLWPRFRYKSIGKVDDPRKYFQVYACQNRSAFLNRDWAWTTKNEYIYSDEENICIENPMNLNHHHHAIQHLSLDKIKEKEIKKQAIFPFRFATEHTCAIQVNRQPCLDIKFDRIWNNIMCDGRSEKREIPTENPCIHTLMNLINSKNFNRGLYDTDYSLLSWSRQSGACTETKIRGIGIVDMFVQYKDDYIHYLDTSDFHFTYHYDVILEDWILIHVFQSQRLLSFRCIAIHYPWLYFNIYKTFPGTDPCHLFRVNIETNKLVDSCFECDDAITEIRLFPWSGDLFFETVSSFVGEIPFSAVEDATTKKYRRLHLSDMDSSTHEAVLKTWTHFSSQMKSCHEFHIMHDDTVVALTRRPFGQLCFYVEDQLVRILDMEYGIERCQVLFDGTLAIYIADHEIRGGYHAKKQVIELVV